VLQMGFGMVLGSLLVFGTLGLGGAVVGDEGSLSHGNAGWYVIGVAACDVGTDGEGVVCW